MLRTCAKEQNPTWICCFINVCRLPIFIVDSLTVKPNKNIITSHSLLFNKSARKREPIPESPFTTLFFWWKQCSGDLFLKTPTPFQAHFWCYNGSFATERSQGTKIAKLESKWRTGSCSNWEKIQIWWLCLPCPKASIGLQLGDFAPRGCSVFSLSFSSAGKGQFLTGIF